MWKVDLYNKWILVLGVVLIFAGASIAGAATDKASLRIGVICPLTGSQSYIGQLIKEAASLAVKEINEKGGIQGHPVEAFYENDEFQTPKSVAAAQKLITQRKVHLLNGPLASSAIAACQKLTDKDIPHVTSCGSASKLTEEPHPWFFRLTLADRYQTAVLVKLAVKDMKLSRVAILAESGSHGQGTIDSWTRDLGQFNLKPVIVERFEDTDVDFSSQLTKVKNVKPDAVVFAPLKPETGANLAKQSKEIGLDVQIFTSSSVAGSLDFLSLAGTTAEGTISPCSFLPTNPDPPVQAFVKNFKALYGHLPEGKEPAQTYDILKILHSYLNKKKADGTYLYPLQFTDASLSKDRALIREALMTVKGYRGATGIEVNFGKEPNPQDRDGIKSPLIAVVKEGQWVPLDTAKAVLKSGKWMPLAPAR
jgi:branched-chain amino acid transport system substrate-binding protein